MTLDGKTKLEFVWRQRVAHLQSIAARSRTGRIALHLFCACIDRQVAWHSRGIIREFSKR